MFGDAFAAVLTGIRDTVILPNGDGNVTNQVNLKNPSKAVFMRRLIHHSKQTGNLRVTRHFCEITRDMTKIFVTAE